MHRVEKLEVFNEELENINKTQKQVKNTIIEIKNTLEGINCRLNDTEEWISKLEYRVAEITDAEQKNKEKKWEQFKRSLRQHQEH